MRAFSDALTRHGGYRRFSSIDALNRLVMDEVLEAFLPRRLSRRRGAANAQDWMARVVG